MKKTNLILKISMAVAYFAMVMINYLANALPIGGVTTGEASDAYSNLYTPAGVTFSIWGIIYILLLVHTLYQFGLWQKVVDAKREQTLAVVGRYYLATSIFNIAWIFAWHYGVIWLSVVIMLCLLFSLIKIADVINKEQYTLYDKIFIRLPFSVYFGWITVATIANIIVLLVSLNWEGFGIAESEWTMIILLAGALIGISRMLKDNNTFYGLVLIWAYGGILLKHTSETGFDNRYPGVIITVIFCIAVFVGLIVVLGYKNRIDK